MRTRTILLATALAAACTTQNNTALVITKVVAPAATTSTTGPTVCSFSTSADEFTFLEVNLTENVGNVAAVVDNSISTAPANGTLGADASTFLPHQAVVAYEFPGNAN